MINDMHVHTDFSSDSEAPMSAHCKKAVRLGMGYLCFTDHIDYNPHDTGYEYYDADEYFAELAKNRAEYQTPGGLQILCGIEFSEPHMYQDWLNEYKQRPYDFIMGSIHFWLGDLFPSQMAASGISAQRCFDTFWEEVYKAASIGGFDCLGHLDFPKRYYGELVYEPTKIYDICKQLVQNNIIIEINTSSLRKGLAEPMPGPELLEIYKQAGGEFVTIGSDAHRVCDLTSGNAEAKRLAEAFGMKEVVFVNRRMVIV